MKNVKKMKKLISSIMLIILAVSCFSPVFASTPITTNSNTAGIVVSGVEAGVEVSSYKIIDVNFDYTAGQPENPAYTWVDEIKSWVTTNYSEYLDLEVFYDRIQNNSEEAQNFYDELTKAIKDGTITLVPTTTTATEETVKFENVVMGTYLIVAENGYKVYMPTVTNIIPEFNSTNQKWEIQEEYVVVAKSTDPQITKTVTNSEKTKDNYSTIDTIPYEIVADVPTFLASAISKTYKISDTLPMGISYIKDSIKVYGIKGTESTELDDTAFTLNELGLGDSFEIDFNYEKIKGYDQVKVTYTAEFPLNSELNGDYYDITTGQAGSVNQVKLVYSNNPYVENSTKERKPDKENKVFTYGLKVTKVDKKDQTKILPGAEFTLSLDGETLYFTRKVIGAKSSWNEEEGVTTKKNIYAYIRAKSTDKGATTNLVADENGEILIKGLDEGEYILTETKAPDGYSIATSTATIKIEDKDLNGILDDSEDTDGIAKIKFTNTKFFVLPLTGGTGTIIFIVAGLTLIVIGTTVIVSKKRKEAQAK